MPTIASTSSNPSLALRLAGLRDRLTQSNERANARFSQVFPADQSASTSFGDMIAKIDMPNYSVVAVEVVSPPPLPGLPPRTTEKAV